MDSSFCIASAGLLVAILSAIYARRGVVTAREALRSGEKARLHQVLVDVLFEYRSAQMLLAIRTLWSFYDEHKKNLGEAYNLIRRKEESEISKLDPERRLERESTTLHYQRRLIGQFYSLAAGMSLRKLARRLEISPPGVGFSVKRGETIARENRLQLIE